MRRNHLNVLRAQAMAGDVVAQQELARQTFIPHHLRGGNKQTAINKKLGVKFKDGVHITAKTHKAVRCRVAVTVSPDYGLDRLQLLKDRRERRIAA